MIMPWPEPEHGIVVENENDPKSLRDAAEEIFIKVQDLDLLLSNTSNDWENEAYRLHDRADELESETLIGDPNNMRKIAQEHFDKAQGLREKACLLEQEGNELINQASQIVNQPDAKEKVHIHEKQCSCFEPADSCDVDCPVHGERRLIDVTG